MRRLTRDEFAAARAAAFADMDRWFAEGDPRTVAEADAVPPATDKPDPCAHCMDWRWCVVTGCDGGR